MKKNFVIASVSIICSIFTSFSNADLFLTVDNQNPTGLPLMLSGTGPFQIAIDGNTILEPNSIRFETTGGIINLDANSQYSFQYYTNSTEGFIDLVTNTDLTIDDINIPANTIIYEIFIFSNIDADITGVCGSDYLILYPPQEEEEEGGENLIQDPNNQSQTSDDDQSMIANDDNLFMENMDFNEEPLTMLMESSSPGIPLYVQNAVRKVQLFKQGGNGKDIVVINEVNQSYCFDNKKIYFISNPPLVIQGNIRVFIPSDTIFVIEQSQDSNPIVVQNGATVIAGISNGQNNNSGLNPPVWIVSISDVHYHHNLCGLSIKQSAKSGS